MDRHGRQTRLAEVGDLGQAQIARARVDVRAGGFAGEIAARYLAGAGVCGLRVQSESIASAARAVDSAVEVTVAALEDDVDETAGGFDLSEPAARQLAQGSQLALEALLEAVRGTE
jgi:hypothetical protein